ncbi:MAG: hypothetical protein ACRCZN_00610 [Lactococcus lactis]
MKVIELKRMLTNFTTGGNNFEVKFVYEALENEDSSFRNCDFSGMNVFPEKNLWLLI